MHLSRYLAVTGVARSDRRSRERLVLSPRRTRLEVGGCSEHDDLLIVVDRGHFDALLLSSAREADVRILHPARAHRPRRADSGWEIAAQTPEGLAEIACRFVVDAAGHEGALLSRKTYRSSRTVVLYGYWRSVPWTGATIRVEAGPDGWFWGGVLPDGRLNAIVFLDPRIVRDRGGEGLAQHYHSMLASFTLLGTCLGGTLTTGVMACDASSYIDQRLVDEHSIKVGEAACSIDPLSSQGVQTALVSALPCSAVVHTLLRKPANTAAALDLYRTHQEEIVAHHGRLSASFYAEATAAHDTDFWKVRGRRTEEQENDRLRPVTSALVSRSTPVRQSPRACAVEVPCIRDGFI
jgi:flavin-dependent dehydrogenase